MTLDDNAPMTRDEVLARLHESRVVFDRKVAAVPRELLGVAPEGHAHSPKDIVAHVNAYEELITERLRRARAGETTEFERDRAGWQAFNEHVWAQVRDQAAEEVLARSASVFAELLGEVAQLTDAELNEVTGVTKAVDPAWLGGRSLAVLIGIDSFEHYGMHFEALDAASA